MSVTEANVKAEIPNQVSSQAKTVRLPVEILSMQRNKRPQVITYSSFQLSEQNSLNTAEGTMKLKLAGGEVCISASTSLFSS